MRIRNTSVWVVDIPRAHALTTAYGTHAVATNVVVSVETDDGLAGWGQTTVAAPWYGPPFEVVVAEIQHYLAPAIVGEDPRNVARCLARMDAALPGALFAKTALEFALWDVCGKALRAPVHTLLGGRVREGIVLHGTVHFGTPDEMAESAREGAAAGWKLMKMKIGLDPRDDLRRYRAVRAAVGDDVRFQLDGNTGYTLGDAIQTIREMERIGGVGIIEQPVKTIAEMAKLVRAIKSPVQADEAVLTPRDAYEIAAAGAAHVLHLKLHKLGGLLRAREIATISAGAGLTVSVAPYSDLELAGAAHFAAATANASWGAGFTLMSASILKAPIRPVGQCVPPPAGDGLGVEVDLDMLRELRRRDL
ncbi:MAG: hypothetical protein FJX78_00555 [Armatimonadetes bacterium]|nr:hypothetical protein [Armatimonadota bacterium]